MTDKIDQAMIQMYLRISGGILFILFFVLGYLYYIEPSPIIVLNLAIIVVLEVTGFNKTIFSFESKHQEIMPGIETGDLTPSSILNNISTLQDYPGFIYVMQRNDGVYKIGRTNSTTRRMIEHIKDYGKGFVLIRRFVVPDTLTFEAIALQLTNDYHYDKEPHRKELRVMDDLQLSKFLYTFEQVCKKAVIL